MNAGSREHDNKAWNAGSHDTEHRDRQGTSRTDGTEEAHLGQRDTDRDQDRYAGSREQENLRDQNDMGTP